MSGEHSPDSDEVLGARLRAEVTRYSAPTGLRAAISQGGAPAAARAWLAPVLAAAATALVLGLVFLLVAPRMVPLDPAERLRRSGGAQPTPPPPWGARAPGGTPTAPPRLPPQAGV